MATEILIPYLFKSHYKREKGLGHLPSLIHGEWVPDDDHYNLLHHINLIINNSIKTICNLFNEDHLRSLFKMNGPELLLVDFFLR